MSQTTPSERRALGKFRGTVADVDDPLEQGRLRARVPSVLGDVPSGWALPCVPYAGDGVGLHAVPPVGAGVWIEFEQGDPGKPVWVGCWWGGQQVPVDHQGRSATPQQKILRSAEGLHVQLDDERQVVTVSDEEGGHRIEISVLDGTVHVEAQQAVVVNAPRIELVQGSSHPVAFGDDLLTYLNQLVALFNAHLHPGEKVGGVVPVSPAPPAPSFPPATPALLSTKVTTG